MWSLSKPSSNIWSNISLIYSSIDLKPSSSDFYWEEDPIEEEYVQSGQAILDTSEYYHEQELDIARERKKEGKQ
jgi:hypothetical protein